jgi:MFS transporter, FHS family, L-fucose permease
MAVITPNNIKSVSVSTTEMRSYTPALISLAVLYFMMGFITCLNDTLVPFFKSGFNLSYSESSLVQFYFFLTYGVISVPAGKLVDKIGYKNGMVAGFFMAALGALLFFPASVFHVYGIFLAALFILAMGIVLLQVSANPYITMLGPAATASSRLTLIQGVGSIGTTVAPIFGSAYILSFIKSAPSSSDAVRIPYLVIGACLILIALIVWRLRLPVIGSDHTTHTSDSGGSARSVFSYRNLNYGIVAIFMYVGAEVSIGTFLTNYIVDKTHADAAVANNYVAFYWGGMLVGRLAGAILLRRVKPSAMLAILASVSVILIMVSLFSSGYFSAWAMILTGVCNSVMFAIIFSLSVNGLGKFTNTASGWLSTAIVGGAVSPFLIGVLKDHFSWQTAFSVPVVCYLYLLFYGVNGYKARR